jgi:hypothetical protein
MQLSIGSLRYWLGLLLALLSCAGTTFAQPAQLGVALVTTDPRVYQGYQEPVTGEIFNFAPTGSSTLSYTAAANFPLSPTQFIYSGQKIGNGGATYVPLPFTYSTTNVTPGVQNLTLSATDTINKVSLNSPAAQITVVAHPTPAIGLNGQIINLKTPSTTRFTTNPDTGAPNQTGASLPPQEAGTEAPAGGFAPGMIGDPPADEPAGNLNLDSITYSGDGHIAIDLGLFQNLPATDSLTENDLPFDVDLFANNPGFYSETYHLF